MDMIRIDAGVHTALLVDLTEFDFTDVEKVILTIKNSTEVNAPALIEREFTEPKIYNEIITPQESLLLCRTAVYDFNKVLTDGTRYKVGDNGKIDLRDGCGTCPT